MVLLLLTNSRYDMAPPVSKDNLRTLCFLIRQLQVKQLVSQRRRRPVIRKIPTGRASPRRRCVTSSSRGTSSKPTCSWCRRSSTTTRGRSACRSVCGPDSVSYDLTCECCFCREILNEERCPGFLLEAVRSAIKKRRKLIKAKMLGIPVKECSSRSQRTAMGQCRCSEEKIEFCSQLLFLLSPVMRRERRSLFGQTEVDGPQVDAVTDKPAESRIRNL